MSVRTPRCSLTGHAVGWKLNFPMRNWICLCLLMRQAGGQNFRWGRRNYHIPMSVFRTHARFRVVDCILWCVIGAIAVLLLVSVALEFRDGRPLNRIGLVVGICLTSLTGLGVFLRWGPIVPCMFLGMVVLMLLTDPIARSHEEAVFKDLGIPLIGAIVGTILGIVVESQRPRGPRSKQDNVNGETPP